MNDRYDRLLSGLTLDAGEGPARRLTPSALETQVSAIVSEVLSGTPMIEPPASPRPAPAPPPLRRLSAVKVVMLVAAGLVTGSAAAMVARQVVRWSAGPQPLSSVEVPPAPPPRPTPTPEPLLPEPEPVVVEEPTRIEAVEIEASADGGALARSTADLMALANRQRGAGRYRAAERTYLSILAADDTAPAAHVAAVAAAAIRLEHLADPRGALALYRRALHIQPSGMLLVECYEGLARANRELGDRPSEVRALKALIGSGHPGPARMRALSRLEALEQVPAPELGDP